MIVKTVKALLASSLILTSLSACGLGVGTTTENITVMIEGQEQMVTRGVQQSDFGSIQDQQAVPHEYIIKRKGASFIEQPDMFAAKYGMHFIKEVDALGVELYQISNPDAVLPQLQADVEFVEPNYLRHLSLPQQSGVQQASTMRAQNAAAADPTLGFNQFIGIIDTGVDTSHPDLQGKLIAGHNTLGSDIMADGHGHGTYLAGIAVGQNPQQELSGVVPGGKILPVKALDDNGIGTDFSIAEGIALAIEYGAKVIVLSASGATKGQALELAFQHANQKNVPIVVPGANSMDAASVYPSASRGVIVVNSIDYTGQKPAQFSSQSNNVSISAVAQGTRSTLPTNPSRLGNGYGHLDAPGAAAMQVAGAIAMLKSRQPYLNSTQARQALAQASDDLGQRGQDTVYGSGRLNIAKVTAQVRNMSTSRTVAPPPSTYNPQAPQQAYPQQGAYPSTRYPQQTYPQQQQGYGYSTYGAPQQNAYPQQTYGQPVYNQQRRGY